MALALRYALAALALSLGAGCSYHHEKHPVLAGETGPTYAEVNRQIFAPSCIQCHGNEGGITLETYEDVKRNLPRIQKAVLEDRTMPKNGSLSPESLALLSSWIRAGAPESASGGARGDDIGPPRASFASIRKNILEPKCAGCHSASGPAAAIPLMDYQALLDKGLVVPGSPDDSGLLVAVSRTDEQRMPPPAAADALGDTDVALIRYWIELGAPESPGRGSSPSTGNGRGDPVPVDARKLSYAYVRQYVFEPKCISCHGTSGGVNLETYDGVRQALSRIAVAALIDKTMPRGGKLTQEEEQILSAWLWIGAPERAGSDQPPPPELKPTYDSIRKRILEPRCVRCHYPDGDASEVPLVPWKAMMEGRRKIVVPGRSDESKLVEAISRADDKRMPPPDSGSSPLSEKEIAAIRKWIDDGALEPVRMASPAPSVIPLPDPTPAPSPSVIPLPSPSPD